MKIFKRSIVIVLVLIMLTSYKPINAFAGDDHDITNQGLENASHIEN